MQFAFLYSYHPTGNMKTLPSELEKKWREAHFNSSEEAFELVEREGRSTTAAATPSFFKISEQKITSPFSPKQNIATTSLAAQKDGIDS